MREESQTPPTMGEMISALTFFVSNCHIYIVYKVCEYYCLLSPVSIVLPGQLYINKCH